MTKVFLKKKISRRIESGHPWIFANEVHATEGDVVGGGTVDVYTHDKKFMGRGYINPQSQILVRLLTRDKAETIDDAFFFNRLKEAWEYRQRIGYTENCRLVFGEADYLPALIIDKFNDYFVIQTLALGMDKWKPAIVQALEKLFSPKGIYERNDVPVRELEGMPQQKGFLSAPFETQIIINENGLRMHVDIENGQKTGYFLDQKGRTYWAPFATRAASRHMPAGMAPNPCWAWIFRRMPLPSRAATRPSMDWRRSAHTKP
jgi:23S rRNA (cytosine1962-C5)-methyltransferase